jgi:TRAP-type transport system periplasmic protein
MSTIGLDIEAERSEPAPVLLDERRSLVKRIAALGAAALLPDALIAPREAKAATPSKFSYKLGLSLAPSHPTTIALHAACADILHESNGRLAIEVFSNSALGGDTDMISQLRSGGMEFLCTAGLIWGTLVPTASISGIGYAFSNYQAVWEAMDGDLGAHIREGFVAANLFPQSKIWDHGFRQITSSSKAINVPQDLVGMKIRVPLSPALTSLFRSFGAAPEGINMAEVYTSLQSKLVDGQENPLSMLETQKLFEVQKYCSLTSHVWDGFWLVANLQKWNALPDDLRYLASHTFDAHAMLQRQAVSALNTNLYQGLKTKGMILNAPDLAPFRQALQKTSFYRDWQRKFGSEQWARLERYSGPLA